VDQRRHLFQGPWSHPAGRRVPGCRARRPGGDFKTRNTRGRQAFLGVEGKLNNYIAYKAEGGAVNGGAWAWDDVVIEYKPTEDTSLLFGNVKVAGIENLTSTRFITFMDRGPYGDFGVDSYQLGVVGKKIGPDYSFTLGVQGGSINNADVSNASADSKERLVITGRAHWAPVVTDSDKVHLAASYRVRNRGDEGAFAYTGRTTTAYSNATFYTTGAIGNRDKTIGVEGAWIHNNLSIQGEYSSIDVTRQGTAGSSIRPSRSATPSSASGRRASSATTTRPPASSSVRRSSTRSRPAVGAVWNWRSATTLPT
jgi:phosphate-selective porin OprO/OprP